MPALSFPTPVGRHFLTNDDVYAHLVHGARVLAAEASGPKQVPASLTGSNLASFAAQAIESDSKPASPMAGATSPLPDPSSL
eukprot:5232630-Lingulodinium_polyedra.AAC.1